MSASSTPKDVHSRSQNGSTKSAERARIGLYGSPETTRRMAAAMNSALSAQPGASRLPGVDISTASIAEAWSDILSNRPAVIVLEIGLRYSDRTHSHVREILGEVRARLGKNTYVIVALNDPERLFFGGDLLFADERSLSPSGWVDSFIVAPPSLLGGIPSLIEQSIEAARLGLVEMQRRALGHIPLPALNDPGWVQSLADPASRALWMRWLPRYASYLTESPIIIGQTGTGKTNLAYALHLLSGRKGQFVSITPRDFSSSELVQAELFGAVAGAYTGAVDKWGLVKSAEKGTLFIDELQSIDKDLQGKLITFIENKSYRRVGSAESIEADVRFVFASNRELNDMMETDVLRHDFAYRLERVQLDLLPLSARRLDIAAGLAHALAKVRRQRPHALQIYGLTTPAYQLLFGHRWPGNLRQLENSVARLCELADVEETQVITEAMVGTMLEQRNRGAALTAADVISAAAAAVSREALQGGSSTSLQASVEAMIDHARQHAVAACGGDLGRAAEVLGDDPDLLALCHEHAIAERELLLRRLPLRRQL